METLEEFVLTDTGLIAVSGLLFGAFTVLIWGIVRIFRWIVYLFD